MTTPTQLFTLLDACFDAQYEAPALWHSQEPEADDVAPAASASAGRGTAAGSIGIVNIAKPDCQITLVRHPSIFR